MLERCLVTPYVSLVTRKNSEALMRELRPEPPFLLPASSGTTLTVVQQEVLNNQLERKEPKEGRNPEIRE